jgi:hypothetical protein
VFTKNGALAIPTTGAVLDEISTIEQVLGGKDFGEIRWLKHDLLDELKEIPEARLGDLAPTNGIIQLVALAHQFIVL